MDDKSKQRCSDAECTANLMEIILDLVGPLMKTDVPSRWSIFIADHIERAIQAKFASTFIDRTDSLISESQKKMALETNSTVIDRLKSNTNRYEQLRPLIQERQKADDIIGRIFTIFIK